MKNLSEILATEPVFLNCFKSKIDVVSEFEGIGITTEEYYSEKPPYANILFWEKSKKQIKKALEKYKTKNILFASYGKDNYLGDAFVLFEEDGKLFEVNGSHCSCYGLEDQWAPEEVCLNELKNRLIKGSFGQYDESGNEFSNELKQFLGIY